MNSGSTTVAIAHVASKHSAVRRRNVVYVSQGVSVLTDYTCQVTKHCKVTQII